MDFINLCRRLLGAKDQTREADTKGSEQKRVVDPTVLAHRFIRGYGLVELDYETCLKKMSPTKTKFTFLGNRDFTLHQQTDDPSTALDYLSILSWPASRHVIFPAGPSHTAFINNSRNGSDFADYRFGMATLLETRAVRVVEAERQVISRGSQTLVAGYEARMLEICDITGDALKVVFCADDGGEWKYFNEGVSMPVEQTFNTTARRVKDRFTQENLHALMSEFGLPVVTAEMFLQAGRYALFKEDRIIIHSCTIEEQDDPAYNLFLRGMEHMQRIETHFNSAVYCFELAILYNPNYESKVWKDLARARKIMNGITQGSTALHVAAYTGDIDLTERLIARGDLINIRDDEGRTPLAVAEKRKKMKVAELLRQHGGVS